MSPQANIYPIRNPLAEFKAISEQMRALEVMKDSLREEILASMDRAQSDEVTFGGLKARRPLVFQERLDSRRLKTSLGQQYQEFLFEIPVIRLSVI